jgi:hypothetical protein
MRLRSRLLEGGFFIGAALLGQRSNLKIASVLDLTQSVIGHGTTSWLPPSANDWPSRSKA